MQVVANESRWETDREKARKKYADVSNVIGACPDDQNGQIITRSVGYAILRVDKAETTDEVVFAEPGDLLLLGCRALEGLNLRVDSRAKKLVAAGPVIAA